MFMKEICADENYMKFVFYTYVLKHYKAPEGENSSSCCLSIFYFDPVLILCRSVFAMPWPT